MEKVFLFLPMLVQFITLAEQYKTKSGAEKKALVLDTTNQILQPLQTFGVVDNHTAAAIKTNAPLLIDAVVGVLNSRGLFAKGETK